VLKLLSLLVVLIFLLNGQNIVFGQEPRLATFQETAQLIIDKQISNNVTAAITLQSSSNQEIRIPSNLIDKIHENERVLSVIITNENQCVLGVQSDDSCVMINFSVQNITGGIIGIQETGKEIGDSLISDITEALDLDVDFHSVYVHHRDVSNEALETSGVISGEGTVSAVYTFPKESTDSMYQKITGILLLKVIRDSGGFIDVAENLSTDENSSMTVSIIPQDNQTLLQIRLSVNYPGEASMVTDKISPLEYLKIDRLDRSNYFSRDFYPLNSLLKVVVLSPDQIKVKQVCTNLVPIVIRDSERFPEFIYDGWFFDQEAGNKIEATYLFGKEISIDKNDLAFILTSINEAGTITVNSCVSQSDTDYFQNIVLIGIAITGAGAVIYFLKGFRVKS
jgi:hypothetical protein